MSTATRGPVTRRAFIGGLAASATAGAVWMTPWCARRLAMDLGRLPPVVSFHMDQPYLDMTGAALPYLPPDGARSAECAAHFDEEAFRGMPI